MSTPDPAAREALHLQGVVLPGGQTQDLFVVDGKFTFQPLARYRTVLSGGYLIPGLVDTHAHLAIASPAPSSATPEQRVRASARAHLDAGVLAVREPGSPNYASHGIGAHEGLPHIVTAGRFLAPRGQYFPGLAREVNDEQMPAAAEEEAKASGAWAKVIGDWIGGHGRMRTNYRRETMAEAARRVHALGARIAVHATTAETIESAIEAGFDSIEHGLGLADDHIAAMRTRRITLVPTLVILLDAPDWMQGLGLASAPLRMMLDSAKRHPEMARQAYAAGVQVLAGTDAGMGPHGMVRQEIGLLKNAGLPQEAALAAGSWVARRFMGMGGIEEGATADLVAYPGDPRDDPKVLARPALRILRGKIVESHNQ